MFKKIQFEQLISFKPTKTIPNFQPNVTKTEDLIDFMEKYDAISDFHLGFERFEGKIDDQSIILRRFNSKAEINKSKSLIANQRVFLANRILGVKKVFEAEELDIKNDDLIKIFNEFNKKLDDFPEKNLETNLSNFKINLDSELNLLAKKSGIENFPKKLEYALGFVLLEFQQRVIVAQIENNDLKLCSVDQPIPPFSEEIQKDLEANFENQEWFKKLSEFEKNLVKSHKDKIFSNNHIIPKGISNLPGLRNAFLRQDFLINKDQNTLISSSENFHMASPAPEIKNPQIQESITEQNIMHLNQTFGRISICSLLDQSEMKKSEKKQTNAMKKTIENHNSNTTTKPIIFSPLGISILSKLSITENLKEMGRVTSDLLKRVEEKEGLDDEKKKKFETLGGQIKSQIKNLEGRSFIIDKLIRNILEILRFIMGFDFKQNQQMKLQADFNKMINLYNQTMPDKEKFLVSINCKSGKDRTGVMQQIFSAQSLSENNNDNEIQPEEIKNLVKKSEHVEYINGSVYGGNSASAKGVLPHTKPILDPEYRDFFGENFFPKISSNGKISSKILKNQIEIEGAEGLSNPSYQDL